MARDKHRPLMSPRVAISSPIDIAVCFDEGIETAALVLLASLQRRARAHRPLRVHAIVDGISEAATDRIGALGNDAFAVELHTVENIYTSMQSRGYISTGTYLRFLIPDLLPACRKIIYLDVDLVVLHDLAALYDIDLAGRALAAVPDFSQINSGLTWRRWRIEYEGDEYTFADYCRIVLGVQTRGRRPYFNAGVLVLDLDRWRRQRIVEKTIAFLEAKPNLRFLDQDALNHVVGRDYVRLDTRWNAFAVHACPVQMELRDRWSLHGREWQALRRKWRADPWIVHFAGANKPWSPTDEPTPLDHLWWEEANGVPQSAEIADAYRRACEAAGTGLQKMVTPP